MSTSLLFLGSSLLGRCLLGSSFLLRRALGRFGMSLGRFFGLYVGSRYFLGLCLSLRLLRGPEALPVEGDFRDAHRGVGLAMSAQLLVLLLALVMKDQNLGRAALFHHLANYASLGLRFPDLARFPRHCEHVGEFDWAFGASE